MIVFQNVDLLIERTARLLATASGQNWELLDNHPGYFRGYCREEAARALGLEPTVSTPDPE